MREIKFRAWVKAINKSYMAIQGEPDLETLGSFMHHYAGELTLMQYTGLKDKNGKEIYEGDVIKYDSHVKGATPNWKGPVKVEYRTEKAMFDWHEDSNDSWSYSGFIYHEYEVIGNIYENPELSKGEV